MGKYGQRTKVSDKIWDRTVGLIGESGIGKTTVMSAVCEKLVGEDGYIVLDIGKENGTGCINNITYEKIPTYQVWDEVTKDIIENKDTDYPNLKILVVDTIDQLLAITEPYAIAAWNKANVGTKDFKKVTTLNAAWGGFGKGMDKVLELILDRIEKLRSVGVVTWVCGHTRSREITDPLTGNTYTSLSADATQKYFVAIKTKIDVLGVACIDRDVVKEETNKKNIMTRKVQTINKIVSENRVIKFRDDNYAVDSKSRLKHIVSEIPLDADELIKALQDAIDAENSGVVVTTPVAKKSEPKPTEENLDDLESTEEPEAEELEPVLDDIGEEDEEEDIFNDVEEEEEEVNLEELVKETQTKYKAMTDKDKKKEVQAFIKSSGGLNAMTADQINEALSMM